MNIDYGALTVSVLSYKKIEKVRRCVGSILESTGGRSSILIWNNDRETDLAPHFPEKQVTILPSHFDLSYARSKNMQIMACLEKTPWGLVCDDDVILKPGWLERIQKHPAYDFYSIGACCFLLNARVLREVGWWDERFIFGAWEDNDYLIRLLKSGLPFVWEVMRRPESWNRRIPSIGLADFWHHDQNKHIPAGDKPEIFDESASYWTAHQRSANERFFKKKWWTFRGSRSLTAFRRLPEINWYPHFRPKEGGSTHEIHR